MKLSGYEKHHGNFDRIRNEDLKIELGISSMEQKNRGKQEWKEQARRKASRRNMTYQKHNRRDVGRQSRELWRVLNEEETAPKPDAWDDNF